MTYKAHSWNIICDVCGQEFHHNEIKKRWDGLLVCKNDFELDHPQKYIRVHSDPIPVPPDWIRQEPEDLFIQPDGAICTATGIKGIAGKGVAGCMISGNQYF